MRIQFFAFLIILSFMFSSTSVQSQNNLGLNKPLILSKDINGLSTEVFNATKVGILNVTGVSGKYTERYMIASLGVGRGNSPFVFFDTNGTVYGGTEQIYRGAQMVNSTTFVATDFDSRVIFWNLETNATELIILPESLQNANLHHDFEYNPIKDTFMAIGRSLIGNIEVNNQTEEFHTDRVIEFNRKGEILFNWSAVENIPLDKNFLYEQNETNRYGVSYHGNSIYWDYISDNFYINFRNLHTFFYVNKTTGDVIWQLGAYKSNFTMLGLDGREKESLFYGQHDIEQISDNKYLIFDNDYRNKTKEDNYKTRLLEFQLNYDTMTATETWSWEAPFDTHYSRATGNIDKMPNGNIFGVFFINTDRERYITEVNRQGEVVWEMQLKHNNIDGVEHVLPAPLVDALTQPTISGSTLNYDLNVWNTYYNRIPVDGIVKIFHNSDIIDTKTFKFNPYWDETNIKGSIDLSSLTDTNGISIVVENADKKAKEIVVTERLGESITTTSSNSTSTYSTINTASTSITSSLSNTSSVSSLTQDNNSSILIGGIFSAIFILSLIMFKKQKIQRR